MFCRISEAGRGGYDLEQTWHRPTFSNASDWEKISSLVSTSLSIASSQSSAVSLVLEQESWEQVRRALFCENLVWQDAGESVSWKQI